jgi:Zn-dependent protease with chaperone function
MTIARYLTILLIELFFTTVCFSQQSPEYLWGKDDIGLRQKYLAETATREKLALSNADQLYSADYKKIYKEEYGQIEKFWSGTRAITNPAVNNYLQAVVQKIISSNPQLKSTDVRVVFSRDWWPNASCMADGSIAINAGLYIFLRNEAELAFVISHELAHYYLHHHEKEIRAYVEKINDEQFQKKLKHLSRQGYSVNQQLGDLLKTMVFDSRRHGRDNEAEADEYALRFMKNTGYDCNAIKTCLQTLDIIDDTTYFTSPVVIQKELDFPGYPFKQSWITKQSSIFSAIKEDDSPESQQEKDSLKTHPDCAKRILSFESHWKDDGKNRNSFLVNEEKFNELKRQLFYEIMEECYREDELSRNLYYALDLLENEPGNGFAVYSVVRCFNRLWYLQKNHQLLQAVEKEDRSFPGQYNLLLRMLDRLRLDDIVSLNRAFAARYAEQMKAYPGFAAELDTLHQMNN